jgi:NAD(P)-dependent dehydrogenase (short-subunit alcohol dehydrogenase family)
MFRPTGAAIIFHQHFFYHYMNSSTYLHDLFALTGQTAVVIGGTGTLCGEMARGLAQAGATVIIAGREASKAEATRTQIRSLGGTAHFIPVEVTQTSSLKKLLADSLALTGQVDILINGAGVNSATPFLEITEEEFDRIVTVNTKAVALSCQVFGAYFLTEKIPGSIINIGSMSGLTPLSRVFTYSLSKAAVHNLTKNLAREWASAGIRVNALVPGFFPAEQNRAILQPERVEKILAHTPTGRFGEASELIGATLLLASRRAGAFITGHELIVDGGFSAMSL